MQVGVERVLADIQRLQGGRHLILCIFEEGCLLGELLAVFDSCYSLCILPEGQDLISVCFHSVREVHHVLLRHDSLHLLGRQLLDVQLEFTDDLRDLGQEGFVALDWLSLFAQLLPFFCSLPPLPASPPPQAHLHLGSAHPLVPLSWLSCTQMPPQTPG